MQSLWSAQKWPLAWLEFNPLPNHPERKKSVNTLTKYIKYLENVGGSIAIEKFDKDWEPIGPIARSNLLGNGFTREEEGVMFLKGFHKL